MPNIKTKNNAKRRHRLMAIDKPITKPAVVLNLQDRVELFQAQFVARSVRAITAEPINLFCCKTGAYMGSISATATAMASNVFENLPDDGRQARTMTTYETNICHPAWFNTSHDNLAVLQKLMPHEYCVYTSNLFLQLEKPSGQRADQLAKLYSESHEFVIEYAELLRRAMALFGKYAAKCTTLPDLNTGIISVNIANLQSWLTASIAKLQRKIHHEDIDRARVVTLADVKHVTFELGSKLFREARIARNEDDALLMDVAEIFEADGADLTTAWTFHKPPTKAKEVAFQGRATGDKIVITRNAATPLTNGSSEIKPIGLFGPSTTENK